MNKKEKYIPLIGNCKNRAMVVTKGYRFGELWNVPILHMDHEIVEIGGK